MQKPAAKIRMTISAALVAALGSLSSCAMEQFMVFISTDAPVPQLGDRVLVQLLNDRGQLACDYCTRLIAAKEPRDWPVSFGVAPEARSFEQRIHVRARLVRTDHISHDRDEDIAADAYVDRVGSLPSLQGTSSVNLFLGTDCFGVPSQLQAGGFATCNPATGLLAAEAPLQEIADPSELTRPDTWLPGTARDCQGAAPEGMVCVPGGTFVLGSKRYLDLGEEAAAFPEHLIVLRPFFMDTMEFTAQRLHQLHATGRYTGRLPLSGTDFFACTWMGTDSDADNNLPLNCIPRTTAAAICAADDGKRLPTEAEWEYATRNLQQQSIYSWGDDNSGDSCERALTGRGLLLMEAPGSFSTDCRVYKDGTLLPWGPMPVCTPALLQKYPDCFAYHPRDQTRLGIWDLAGNVGEWVQDDFKAYSSECWKAPPSHPNFLDNPRCQNRPSRGAETGNAALRGGSWNFIPSATQAATRFYYPGEKANYGIGFRCVKDG